MYEVMHRVAKVSFDYVTHGRSSPGDLIWQILIIAARTAGGVAYQEMIKEVDSELTTVVEDFDRAMNVEALRRTKGIGEHSSSPSFGWTILNSSV
jgi:hypothetical protein